MAHKRFRTVGGKRERIPYGEIQANCDHRTKLSATATIKTNGRNDVMRKFWCPLCFMTWVEVEDVDE